MSDRAIPAACRTAALVLAAAVLPATAAWACRCIAATPAASYHAADAVVLAEVTGMSDRDPLARRYTVRIAESWKRRLPARIVVRSERSDCQADLARGRRYLLYLDMDDGGFSTEACSGNLPAERAGARLKVLREGARQHLRR